LFNSFLSLLGFPSRSMILCEKEGGEEGEKKKKKKRKGKGKRKTRLLEAAACCVTA